MIMLMVPEGRTSIQRNQERMNRIRQLKEEIRLQEEVSNKCMLNDVSE